jgi:hypothetical protein
MSSFDLMKTEKKIVAVGLKGEILSIICFTKQTKSF